MTAEGLYQLEHGGIWRIVLREDGVTILQRSWGGRLAIQRGLSPDQQAAAAIVLAVDLFSWVSLAWFLQLP